MKREHWFLIAGIAIGMVLAGARCSVKFDDSNPDCKRTHISTGPQEASDA